MDVTVTCPYCNADKAAMFGPTPMLCQSAFETSCCKRWAFAYYNDAGQQLVYRPVLARAKEMGITGDISNVLESRESKRPNSRFTWVFLEGLTYVVRLVPKFMNLEKAGRAWGLGLGQRFTSPHEAHLFADSVDEFMQQMIKEFSQESK